MYFIFYHFMENSIKNLEIDQIMKILDSHDSRRVNERVKKAPDMSGLKSALSEHIDTVNFGKKSILGIDIRGYGSFDDFEQPLIPVLYQILFDEAIELSIENLEFTFQKYDAKRIKEHTISTGDGGFIVFDTPLHSLLFASCFAIALRLYNAYHLYPKLRAAIGEINLRYAITYDRIYRIDNNFYGRSLINNSRIIGKDNLNRCLIDEGSYQWFLLNIDGLENLQVMGINELANIHEFQDYDLSLVSGKNSFFEEKQNTRNFGIINSDILKIGMIQSKNTFLNVYNLHIQVSLLRDDDEGGKGAITVSLGNLNTTGI